MASVAERKGPDSHRSDRNRENPGVPTTRVHPHGWTACVSTGAVSYFTTNFLSVCLVFCSNIMSNSESTASCHCFQCLFFCKTPVFVSFFLKGLELSRVVQACWSWLPPESWPCRLKLSAASTAIKATKGPEIVYNHKPFNELRTTN